MVPSRRERVLVAIASTMGLAWMACGGSPPVSITPPVPAATDTPSGPCQATASGEVSLYMRPDPAAEVFSTMGAGSATPVEAQTASGWLGFDPGVAQAANIGPFRLRWLDPGTVDLSGDCGSLPVVWGPPAGVCFDMPMDDVDVHAEPTSASAVLTTLHPEQFAAVLGLNGTGWAKVDLGPGNTGSTVVGWVEAGTLNLNGPCEGLPIVTE